MGKNRPTWMVLGTIVAGIGLGIFLMGSLAEPAQTGVVSIAIGGVLVAVGMAYVFWGGGD